MNRSNAILVLAFVIGINLPVSAADNDWGWHTRPDKWVEPRIWHRDFKYEESMSKDIEKWLVITRETGKSMKFKYKELSPNKAYWFGVDPNDVSKEDKHHFFIESEEIPIYVFNERDYLVKILLKNHYPNFTITVYWINQKLLYIENWWGGVLGAYYIVDVEKEKVISKELVNDGYLPFIQWQQNKK